MAINFRGEHFAKAQWKTEHGNKYNTIWHVGTNCIYCDCYYYKDENGEQWRNLHGFADDLKHFKNMVKDGCYKNLKSVKINCYYNLNNEALIIAKELAKIGVKVQLYYQEPKKARKGEK